MDELLFDFLCVVIPVLGVMFISISILLFVRLINRRERWAKRLAAALVLMLFVYLAAFGPIARLEYRGDMPRPLRSVFKMIYFPIGWGLNLGPPWIQSPIFWYLDLWGAK